jgi:hypothetical protein
MVVLYLGIALELSKCISIALAWSILWSLGLPANTLYAIRLLRCSAPLALFGVPSKVIPVLTLQVLVVASVMQQGQ